MLVSEIENIVNAYLEGQECFLVEVQVKKGNVINIFVDGDKGVNIAECVKISRFIESKLDRDKEDYELKVSSPGIDKPFKMKRQYKRYLGREIEVLTTDDKKWEGSLISVSEEEINLQIKQGKKGKEVLDKRILFSEIAETRPVISFKVHE
jgi:ribosome maturation factor RimP